MKYVILAASALAFAFGAVEASAQAPSHDPAHPAGAQQKRGAQPAQQPQSAPAQRGAQPAPQQQPQRNAQPTPAPQQRSVQPAPQINRGPSPQVGRGEVRREEGRREVGRREEPRRRWEGGHGRPARFEWSYGRPCLLYTSDAADE